MNNQMKYSSDLKILKMPKSLTKYPLSSIACSFIIFSCSSVLVNAQEVKGIEQLDLIQTVNGVFPKGASENSVNGVNVSSTYEAGRITPTGYVQKGETDLSVIDSVRSRSSAVELASGIIQPFSSALSGDFNGDGCTDSATVNSNSKYIDIYHPCTNSTKRYSFSGSIAVNGIYDTDGEPGLEIGVVNAPYFKIIDDEDQTTRSYTIGTNWAINGNYDADGEDGNEIGIVNAPYFKIINDKKRRIDSHNIGTNWAINGAYDADGEDGVEIGILQPHYLKFISDRDRDITSKYISWSSWSVNGAYDTDGDAGVELGLVSSGYFSLFDLRDYSLRNYGIGGAYHINGTQNIDGNAGEEVLINNYGNSRNATIYDSSQTIIWQNY